MLTLALPFRSRPVTFLILAFCAVSVSACGVNTLPTLEEQAKARWSDVQNQYQRRAELIPNLVETVKGFAKQESDVLTRVIGRQERNSQPRGGDLRLAYSAALSIG